MIDGTRVPRARPSDEEQRDRHTRKNKTHCTNTVTATNLKTVTAHVSETLPGSRNDIVMLGGWTRCSRAWRIRARPRRRG